MKPVHYQCNSAALITLLALAAAPGPVPAGTNLLDHEVRRLHSDRQVNLQQAYRGRVVLIVNTASQCAFTDQYGELEALYAEYRDRGLVVLGFPSNVFGQKEPGDEGEISDFCRLTYGVRFPMFAKSRVKEGGADPLFRGLAEAGGRYPTWNFHKYLLDREGRLVANFPSWTAPRGAAVIAAIERLL